jgi:pseudouridylate synthase
VPVIGYQTDEFPAFYTRRSGVRLPWSVEDPHTLARVIRAHWRLHPHTGVLVVNPIPEAHALNADEIEAVIQRALYEAREAGITGKALTPHLLARLDALTEGRSVEANVALAEHNARLAGELAMALGEIEADREEPRA